MENPFKALTSYRENDAYLFYGRKPEKLALYNQISHNILTVLYGKSGAGKSSLINAGIRPILRKKGYLPVTIRTADLIRSDHVSGHLISLLRAAAKKGGLTEGDYLDPSSSLLCRHDSLTLWEYFHRCAFKTENDQEITPVLILDQFEEIFTLANQINRPNIQELVSAIASVSENYPPRKVVRHHTRSLRLRETEPRCRLVLVIRAQFIADLGTLSDRIPGVSLNFNNYFLDLLSTDQAREVLDKAGDDFFEDSAKDKIIKLISLTDQTSMLKIKDKVEPSLLSLFCYELIENTDLSGGEKICADDIQEEQLFNYLKSFYKKATGDISASTKEYLEDNLISGGARIAYSYLRTLQDGVGLDELNRLENRKIIRKFSITGGEQGAFIEIIHDKLIDVIEENKQLRKAEEEKQRIERQRQLDRDEYERQRIVERHTFMKVLVGVAIVTIVILTYSIYKARTEGKKSANFREITYSDEGSWINRLDHNQRDIVINTLFSKQNDTVTYNRLKSSFTLAANAISKISSDPLIALHLARKAMDTDSNSISYSVVKKFPEVFLLNSHSFDAAGEVKDLSIHPDPDKALFASAENNKVRFWSLQDYQLQDSITVESSVAISRILYRPPNGNLLLVIDDGGAAKVIDPVTQDIKVLAEKDIRSAAFSRDGSILLLGDNRGYLQIYEFARSGLRPRREIKVHEGAVLALAFSHDDQMVASSLVDSTVKIWTTDRYTLINSLSNDAKIGALAFAPSDTALVIGSDDEKAYVWDYRNESSMREVRKLSGHTDYVMSVAVDPATGDILTCSNDNTARVWGSEKGDILEHGGDVYDGEFVTINGERHVITASKDKKIRLWKFLQRDDVSGKKIFTANYLEEPLPVEVQLDHGMADFREVLQFSDTELLLRAAWYYNNKSESTSDRQLIIDYDRKKEQLIQKINTLDSTFIRENDSSKDLVAAS